MLHRITQHSDHLVPRVIDLRPMFAAKAPLVANNALPTLRVGRHPECDVVLTYPYLPLMLSRYHAELLFNGEDYTVRDLGTTNGTYVRFPRDAAARSVVRAAKPTSRCAMSAHPGS